MSTHTVYLRPRPARRSPVSHAAPAGASPSASSWALFTAAVGHHPAVHQVARHEEPSPARCSTASPARCRSRSTPSIPVLLVWGAFALRRPGAQLGARRARTGAAPPRRTSSAACADFRAGAYMQTLLRDSAAGLMHSMIYFGFLALLGVTTVLEIDHQMPESAQVPPRPHLHGVLVRRRPRRRSCSSSASCGRSCAATCSARTASASRPSRSTRSSSACSSSSACPASSPRRSASPRIGRPSYEKWSFIGYPLSKLFDGLSAAHARHLAPDHVDRPRRRVRRVPRDPADHDAAAHVHLAAEHVPARTAIARRAR